jgi:hypothetical protein
MFGYLGVLGNVLIDHDDKILDGHDDKFFVDCDNSIVHVAFEITSSVTAKGKWTRQVKVSILTIINPYDTISLINMLAHKVRLFRVFSSWLSCYLEVYIKAMT